MIVILGSLGATLAATVLSDAGNAGASPKRAFLPSRYDSHGQMGRALELANLTRREVLLVLETCANSGQDRAEQPCRAGRRLRRADLLPPTSRGP